MTFKTMQEQEREAYITGHLPMAALLADVIDAEVEHENRKDREWEKDQEIDELYKQAGTADDMLDIAKNNIEELELTNARLEREIVELNELIADLRDTIKGDK